jgi:hypothetical protein
LILTRSFRWRFSFLDMIRRIIKEWLETNAYSPVHELDEDGEVERLA